jgi:hypothetical protein
VGGDAWADSDDAGLCWRFRKWPLDVRAAPRAGGCRPADQAALERRRDVPGDAVYPAQLGAAEVRAVVPAEDQGAPAAALVDQGRAQLVAYPGGNEQLSEAPAAGGLASRGPGQRGHGPTAPGQPPEGVRLASRLLDLAVRKLKVERNRLSGERRDRHHGLGVIHLPVQRVVRHGGCDVLACLPQQLAGN